MNERQEKIINAIVEEYIIDARAVGSSTLSRKYGLGIGPAMIRQEMAVLEKNGWLLQPHTSAGRVPTDKSYRFYISKQLEKKRENLTERERDIVKRAVKTKNEEKSDFLKEVSRVASEISRELSIVGLVSDELLFTHGFANLASEPELKNSSSVIELMKLIDDLDSYFWALWRHMNDKNLRVFIGEENPVREIRDFTVIAGCYDMGRGRNGFVSLVGPRRMNYKKNMALVDYISSSIDGLKQ